jgi:acyl dehydratase
MTVTRLEKRPSLGRLYAKAIISARGRHGDRLPDVTLELPEATIDRDHLASYADVCGFRHSDVLPATYPHVLAFPLAVSLMVDPAFPFALPGLVHVANRITQTRALRADERLSLHVWAADLREHPRGRQFDMLTEASVNGDPVWTESSTYLHRVSSPSPTRRDSPSPAPRDSPSPARGGGQGGGFSSIWQVPRNVGRRYAAVSGDVNPIHLNPLAARLFGFRRAIAHGMWLNARCLAALEGRLSDALHAQVEFKSPVLLPSTVGFSGQLEGTTWTLAVSHLSRSRLHLTGSVQ